jgi:predicted dehydrogenase
VQPVRFGLVGFGFGGRYFHAPLIDSAVECDLVAVLTSSPERRAEVAHLYPHAVTATSLADLAAQGVEAVAISTPADTHTELSEQALRLGLAVVCDKPFALNEAAARATAELADTLGPMLSPYQNRRWDSDFRTVRRLSDTRALGTITRFESRFERFAPTVGPGRSGGGTLLDFCSHLIDQALVLMGPAVSVYSESRVRESGLDDDVFVALTHPDGARSHLWGSWTQHAPGPRYRVTGTEGSYVLAAGDTQEDVLVAGGRPDSLDSEWGVEPEESWGRRYDSTGSATVPTETGQWDRFYPAFARAVRGEAPPPVSAWDAVATAKVLDAASRSAETGGAVRIVAPGS